MSFKRVCLNCLMISTACLVLVACGGSDNETSAPSTQTSQSAPEPRSAPEPAPEPETEMAAETAPASSDEDGMASDMPMPMDEPTEAAAPAENPVTVGDDGVARLTIGSTDTMQYTVRAFTVEAGQDVELTLAHEGSLPIDVMGHNVVILPIGGDYVAFSREVMSAGGSVDNDYIPEDMREGLVAYTQLIGGGQSDTISFTVPDEPGEYPFLCTFPGHFGVMNGIMTVL